MRVILWNWKQGILALLLPFILVPMIHLIFDLRWLVSIALGWGAVSLFWFVMRRALLRHHVRGVKSFRSTSYREAIAELQEGLELLRSKPYLDRYRSLLFGSPSNLGYRDMELLNMATCYVRLEDGEKARACYEEALRANPQNRLAQNALQTIDTYSKVSSLDEGI